MANVQAIKALTVAAADLFEETGHAMASSISDTARAAAGIDPAIGTRRAAACDLVAGAVAAMPRHAKADAFGVALEAAIPHLAWFNSTNPDLPERYRSGHAFVELAGVNGHISVPDIRFGVFLIAPKVFYPPHSHAAEELFYIASGRAEWQQDSAPYEVRAPGTTVHNVPWRPHAMRTGAEPLLLLWGWRGDVDGRSYRIL